MRPFFERKSDPWAERGLIALVTIGSLLRLATVSETALLLAAPDSFAPWDSITSGLLP